MLISIFVLSIGVIGAAGMQLTALRTTQQSNFQTTALELAAEMADKMRANANQIVQSDNPFLKVDYQSVANSEPAEPDTLCYGATMNCSADELAQFNIYEWEKRIKASLPSGRAVICHDASPWDSGAGALRWDCDGSSGAGASIVIKLGWQAKNPDGSLIADSAKQFPPNVVLAVASNTK